MKEDHFWKLLASLPLPTFSSLNSTLTNPNTIGLNIINYENSLTSGDTIIKKPQK